MYIYKRPEWPTSSETHKAWLSQASQDTALRDIRQLVEQGVLVRNPGGGRSTSYSLAALVQTPSRE